MQNPHAVLISVILAITGALYFPGLFGLFLLDDGINLPAPQLINSPTDFDAILAYVVSGFSGPSGRPVSLLSFALQGHLVAEGAFYFKLANLALHLINGLLIYKITLLAIRAQPSSKAIAEPAALLIMAVWLLHPLQVSTVLYVVQRMTELSAMFTLAGILIYLYARTVIPAQQWKKSLFLQSGGLVLGLLLGILSKENAILLCLFIGVAELTLLRPIQRPKYWTIWAAAFLVFPTIATVLYLLPNVIDYAFSPYPFRSYSATERLLTEFRVVLDYLANIVLPRPNSFGLFHSDYPPSKGLFNPISTFLSFAALFALALVGIILRKREPLISFGILWFFAGHALESTALNLELYFEHRNYLPILGIIIAITAAAIRLITYLKQKQYFVGSRAIIGGVGIWFMFLLIVLYNETHLWGNPLQQASIWAENNPKSHRAQGHYSHILTQLGLFTAAKERYKQNVQDLPDDPTIPLLWLELKCVDDTIETPPHDLVLNRLQNGKFEHAVLLTLDEMISLKRAGKCNDVSSELLLEIVAALLQNPNYADEKSRQSVLILTAKTYWLIKDYESTISFYNQAFQINPNPDILLAAAEIHALAGNYAWYRDTVSMLKKYCSNNRLKCIPYSDEIKSHINAMH